jgi:hypothetical protein
MTVPMNAHVGEPDVFILHARLCEEFGGAVIERRSE